jgi:hypothetical protein
MFTQTRFWAWTLASRKTPSTPIWSPKPTRWALPPLRYRSATHRAHSLLRLSALPWTRHFLQLLLRRTPRLGLPFSQHLAQIWRTVARVASRYTINFLPPSMCHWSKRAFAKGLSPPPTRRRRASSASVRTRAFLVSSRGSSHALGGEKGRTLLCK